MITWELRLYDNDGLRVATFDTWPALQVEVGVNRPAVFALELDGNDPRVALFEHDGILEGWWTDADAGIAWRREFCGLCVDPRKWTDAQGGKHYQISGLGLEDVLNRTIIDQDAGSAASRKTGVGETVLKAWVNQEAGPGAGARARTGLSIEADAAAGGSEPSVDSRAFQVASRGSFGRSLANSLNTNSARTRSPFSIAACQCPVSSAAARAAPCRRMAVS